MAGSVGTLAAWVLVWTGSSGREEHLYSPNRCVCTSGVKNALKLV